MRKPFRILLGLTACALLIACVVSLMIGNTSTPAPAAAPQGAVAVSAPVCAVTGLGITVCGAELRAMCKRLRSEGAYYSTTAHRIVSPLPSNARSACLRAGA